MGVGLTPVAVRRIHMSTNQPSHGSCYVFQRSIFQLVMITDGQVGFMMYLFSDIGASDNFRKQAVHGYSDGTQFTQLEYSRRESETAGAANFERFTKPFMHNVLGNSMGR